MSKSHLAIRPAVLTPQRRKVLEYVAQFDEVPAHDEVAKHMGWRTVTGVVDVYNALRGAGLMERLSRLPGPRRPARWIVTDMGLKAISGNARKGTDGEPIVPNIFE